MPDFLLEIGCEEIPARMLDKAREVLRLNIWELLGACSVPARDVDGQQIQPEAIATFSTPRRVGLLVKDVPERQPDKTELIVGPATKFAYKDGNPTPAAEAFARKTGRNVGELEIVQTEKGEYLAATVHTPGRPVIEILADNLPKLIGETPWEKTMYWRGKGKERFVRPVRWIVALFGSEVIAFEFAGIKAGRISRGHRVLCTGSCEIPEPAQYEKVLRSSFVIASESERRRAILEQLILWAGPTLRIRETDPHFYPLLYTVANLTEWPSVIMGDFDVEFLSLPKEILTTVMRDHQKYFGVEDTNGNLAPHFLAVLNTDADRGGLMRHGNERVLRARFDDARFFWNTDQKIPLIHRAEMLAHVTFQKDLGNYYEKAERMAQLAERIPEMAHLNINQSAVHQAALLAKTDLTTDLVKEFTELQGIVGGLYAKAQGLPQSVADAIYDHYKPESMEDSVPRTLEGAVLSIADKADTIAGMYALGLKPTGSKDPFALRRQANGIVRICITYDLPLDFIWLMSEALRFYPESLQSGVDRQDYLRSIALLHQERVDFYLREIERIPYDVVFAVLNAENPRSVTTDLVARAKAVKTIRGSEDFNAIASAFKRMKNILRQAEETKKKVAEPFNPSALSQDEEKKLSAAVPQVAKRVKELSASRQYEPALTEISRLRPAIDAFFDKVMVMVEDEALRANRLGLLQTIVREFSSIADFSEIVTEKK